VSYLNYFTVAIAKMDGKFWAVVAVIVW